MSLTMSGQFALSQEYRLAAQPLSQSGRMPTGTTPSQAYRGLPTGTLSGEVQNPFLSTGMHALPSQPMSAPLSQAAPTTTNTWLPRIAVVLSLLIASGFLALRFMERQPEQARNDGPSDTVTPSAAPGSLAARAAKGSQSTAQQNHVVVTVTSNPPGARVSVEGKTYGETPADIEWWGDQATPGREVSFVLQKEGFDKATVVRSIVGERLNVDAQLSRAAVAPRRRPAQPQGAGDGSPRPANPQGTVVVPDDFKDDPY
jgi:hypothetical protein